LDSPNQNFRIEALYALEMLGKHYDHGKFKESCRKYLALKKVSKLLDESA